MSEQILRINYAALPVWSCPTGNKNTRQHFRCWLDDGTLVGPETGLRSPALDGARWLVAQGVSPDRLMTTRAASSSVDSWLPSPVGIFAKLAVEEPDSGGRGPRVTVWRAQSAAAVSTETATTSPPGAGIADNGKGAENVSIDAPALPGDAASNPATALWLSDAAQSSAACDLRAASAHQKGKRHG